MFMMLVGRDIGTVAISLLPFLSFVFSPYPFCVLNWLRVHDHVIVTYVYCSPLMICFFFFFLKLLYYTQEKRDFYGLKFLRLQYAN